MRIVADFLKIPKNKIKFLNGKHVGHYVNAPTLFTPRAGKKINIKNEQEIEIKKWTIGTRDRRA